MTKSWLSALHDGFDQLLADLVPEGMCDDEVAKMVETVLRNSQGEAAQIIRKELRRRAPETLGAERESEKAFEARNFDRWRPAFDLFEEILLILTEVGGEHDSALRPAAVEARDWKFEAISHLHARSLLVGREIYALLKAGYPDGALSRWRALHEHSVIASFIASAAPIVAYRYLVSFHVGAYAAAKQVNEHADRANLTPFSESELEELRHTAEAFMLEAGDHPLKKDYDWALPGLNGAAANFRQIELATGLDHWRPRYRWASQHNHGGHRPWLSMLGMSESRTEVALVGASNSGFVDPLQMAAISLSNVFIDFMLLEPNVDRLIMIEIVRGMVDELGETALRVEGETLARAMGGDPKGGTGTPK